jgi:hypothetical protein
MLHDTSPSGNDNPPTPDDLHGDSPVNAMSLPADERAFMDRHFGYDRPFDDFDIDEAFVAEMERRDAAAITTAGNVAIMDSLADTLERGAM